jgi:hypothetical protein
MIMDGEPSEVSNWVKHTGAGDIHARETWRHVRSGRNQT